MTDFSSTSVLNIGNTEQIDDTSNPNIYRAGVTNHSTSDGGQIIESDDNTETHPINNLEQNGGIELQRLTVTDDIVRILRGDGEPNIPDLPVSPIDLHASSSNNKYFPEFINNWKWKIILGIILVAVALTTVTIVIILRLKRSDHVSVDRYRKNKNSAYYTFASYDNDITDPHWRIHVRPDDHHFKYNRESDEFILNHHGISILQLKVQPEKQLQTNFYSTDISCIKCKATDIYDRVLEACQRISASLKIPFSVFLIAPVNGKQPIEVMDKYKKETLVFKSLSVISLHETDSLATAHFELDITNTKLIGDGRGILPWTATNSHGKTSLIYHKQLKLFEVREQGNYLILLSLNTDVYSSKKRKVLIQTCLVANKNEVCRRLVLEKGMSAPLTALDINRLSEGDTVFVKFSNLPELYYSKLNSLTFLRLPENIQFSKYELNDAWPSEFVILKWKEIAARSKAISLHGGIVFDVHEDGNYWIVVCLTIDTNQRLVKNMNEISACIIISDGKQHCQNISVQTGVVFPMMVTTVTYIQSGQSFRITLKNITLLYRSRAFNSLFVLKL